MESQEGVPSLEPIVIDPYQAAAMRLAADIDKGKVSLKGFPDIYGVMVASRQLYAIARSQLSDCIARAHPEDPAMQAALAAVVVAKAGDTVARLNDGKLLATVHAEVLPWLKRIVQENNRTADYETRLRQEALEVARRDKPIPVGLPLDHAFAELSDPSHLSIQREDSWLIVGPQEAIDVAISKAMRTCLAEPPDDRLHVPFVVIRFAADATEHFSNQLAVVPKHAWEPASKLKVGLQQLLQRTICRLAGKPDLFLVDDLPAMANGKTPERVLIEMRRLAFELGASIISGVSDPAQVTATMKSHNTVATIEVKGEEDQRVVLTGTRNIRL